jgi:hypothetical protein
MKQHEAGRGYGCVQREVKSRYPQTTSQCTAKPISEKIVSGGSEGS